MAIIAKKSAEEVYTYVPISERGEKKPFTVKVRRLTPKEYTFIEDKITRYNQDETISFSTGTFNWNVVKKGLVDWENLLDEKGKPIPIEVGKDGVLDSSLNLLPLDIITEIANLIINLTKDPENADIYLIKSDEEPAE
jgi:hypothetical protein